MEPTARAAAKKMTLISDCRTTFYSTRGQLQLSQQRGFTLLEILLVITIIAMASIFVVPNLGGFEARTFSTQVRQAHSLLNYARRTAVVTGQASTVSFNVMPAEDRSSTEQGRSQSSLSTVVAQWHGSGIELRIRDSTDKETEIEQVTEVPFYPEGGSTGGMLLFAQADQVGIIDIDPFTGRVSIRDSEERFR